MSEGTQIKRVGHTILAISSLTSLLFPIDGWKEMTFEKSRGKFAAILKQIEAPQS